MFNVAEQSIVFEQAVNELVRFCLRVEHLLGMMQQGLRGSHLYDTRIAISALADLLSLTDRPDLRGKFSKEFFRQQANLQRFLHHQNINHAKLQTALEELNDILSVLPHQNGKFGAHLRTHEFLTSIRQHLSIAGGGLSFDVPAFHRWLQQPVKTRHIDLLEWIKNFEDLFQITALLLRLIRQSGQPVLYTAEMGFYQASLDTQIPCQLIQVTLNHTLNIYPEMSVGRHGVNIKFYSLNVNARSVPYEKAVPFYLSCCMI